MRADAQRNRDRIVEVARQVFREKGYDAPLDEIAKKAGADHAEVLVRDGSELTAKVRLGEPELVQEAGSRALGLRVLVSAKRAVTYTSDLRREALEALCAESVALAQLAEADEYALPPDPALLAKQLPELDLYDPAVAEVEASWALREAKTGEAAAMRQDKRITNSEGATWSRVLGATAFATSGGFVSNGMAFLLTVMPARPSAASATLPVRPREKTSTSIRWLSVPPLTSRKPAAARPDASRAAFFTICC